eukprot:c21587_g1_i1 orf=74-367(-)
MERNLELTHLQRGSVSEVDQAQGCCPSLDEENPAQQQAILESLASYLEGDLMLRLHCYSDRLTEVCEHAQSLGMKTSLIELMQAILSSTIDNEVYEK